jgi:hypothetical protein
MSVYLLVFIYILLIVTEFLIKKYVIALKKNLQPSLAPAVGHDERQHPTVCVATLCIQMQRAAGVGD